MSTEKNPAVSIVIPMYNVEKYVGECLESILAQTFTDFEVIVVDDCSTDKSYDIVESYIPKFENKEVKLKLVRSEKNSGAPGIPTDKGISLASGDYIFCLDDDDLIIDTALEELYTIAKKFDADVVHCEKFVQVTEQGNFESIQGLCNGEFVAEPVLLTENFSKRVLALYEHTFVSNLWTKFIRRQFILENDLHMIDANAHDAVYTCCLVCSAKRYVIVPNVVNIYRLTGNSLSRRKENIKSEIHKRINTLIKGFLCLNEFLSSREFFQNFPDMKFLVLEFWVRDCCQYLNNLYEQIPPHQLYEYFQEEFEQAEDKTALFAFIFNRMNMFSNHVEKLEIMMNQIQSN